MSKLRDDGDDFLFKRGKGFGSSAEREVSKNIDRKSPLARAPGPGSYDYSTTSFPPPKTYELPKRDPADAYKYRLRRILRPGGAKTVEASRPQSSFQSSRSRAQSSTRDLSRRASPTRPVGFSVSRKRFDEIDNSMLGLEIGRYDQELSGGMTNVLSKRILSTQTSQVASFGLSNAPPESFSRSVEIDSLAKRTEERVGPGSYNPGTSDTIGVGVMMAAKQGSHESAKMAALRLLEDEMKVNEKEARMPVKFLATLKQSNRSPTNASVGGVFPDSREDMILKPQSVVSIRKPLSFESYDPERFSQISRDLIRNPSGGDYNPKWTARADKADDSRTAGARSVFKAAIVPRSNWAASQGNGFRPLLGPGTHEVGGHLSLEKKIGNKKKAALPQFKSETLRFGPPTAWRKQSNRRKQKTAAVAQMKVIRKGTSLSKT